MTTAQIASATTKELIAFYNANAAKPVTRFSTRAAAEARCLPFATATAPKAEKKAAASEGLCASFKPELTIVVIDEDRAAKMREGSRRAASLAIVRKGKNGVTVAEYVKNGGDRLDLHKLNALGIVRVA